ncbi:hypothetical protein [Otoolea muris]|uniref:hypothetical protein n=1 Tax=Otoolea muris TaxID=2941515 RepID=UPI00203B916D|nr:hypothetical protein [Otoolea muris]
MPGMLLEIQETVEKYADIMSKVAQVEVEAADENLFRVAGSRENGFWTMRKCIWSFWIRSLISYP